MTKPTRKWLSVASIIGALALLMAAAAFVPARPAQAATITISPDNGNIQAGGSDWYYYTFDGAGSPGGETQRTARATTFTNLWGDNVGGDGSFRMRSNDSVNGGKAILTSTTLVGQSMASISALSYDTYIESGSTSGGNYFAPYINFYVDVEGDGTYSRSLGGDINLIFEPIYLPAGTGPSLQTWETWDLLTVAGWHEQNGNYGCTTASPCTWSDIIAGIDALPGTDSTQAIVHPFTLGVGGFTVNLGDTGSASWNNAEAGVDQFVFNADTYDFEPGNTVYVDDAWSTTAQVYGQDAGTPGDFFGTDQFGLIQEGIEAVAPGGTVNVAAGTYTEDTLAYLPVTINGAGADLTTLSGSSIAMEITSSDVNVSDLQITSIIDAVSVTGATAYTGINLSELFITNADRGLFNLSPSTNISLNNSCIVNNSFAGVDNLSGSADLDATNNWWGSSTGPSGAGSGTGDSVTANVTFSPFLTTPPTFGTLECPFASTASILYVDDTADGTPIDGSTWDNAYRDLQSALTAAAGGGVDILMAQGVYYPDVTGGSDSNDENVSFNLVDGTAIYGGYAGDNAPDPDARDTDVYVTVLSGDITQNDAGFAGAVVDGNGVLTVPPTNFNTDYGNSDNVVIGSACSTNGCAVDGLTITAGQGNDNGAGLFNSGGDLTLNDIVWSGNVTRVNSAPGGGLFSENGDVTVDNSLVIHNITDNRAGAGLDFRNGGNIVVRNTAFYGNIAENGNGGGVIFLGTTSATAENLAFVGNSGDAIYYDSTTVNATNITIAYNADEAIDRVSGTLNLTNSIVWGNGSLSTGGATLNANYSNTQGGVLPGTNNISTDPLFAQLPNNGDGFWTTQADNDYGNLYLQPTSPSVDSGDDGALSLTTDLNGRDRFVDIPNPPATGTSIIDVGAFETSFPVIDLSLATGRQYFGCGRSGTEGICYFPTTITGRLPGNTYSYTVVMQQQGGISHTFWNSWAYGGTGSTDEFYIGVYRNDTLGLVNRAMDLANPQTIEFTIYDHETGLCIRSNYRFQRTNKGLSGTVAVVSPLSSNESIVSDCSGGLAGDALYYDDNFGNNPTP